MLIVFFPLAVFSQDRPQLKKKYYVNSEGKLYWQGQKPMYLFVSDNPEGKNFYRLKSEQHAEYTNPMYLDTEGVNFVRSNWAADSTGKQILPKFELLFEVYKDTNPPETTVELINSPAYKNPEKKQFYGKDLLFKSSAVDAYSGIQRVFYSLDNATFVPYKTEMNFDQDKEYDLKVYAADNVGNVEPIQMFNFRVDLNAPNTEYEVHNDRSGMIFSPRSYFTLASTDGTSGVNRMVYKIDDGKELPYAEKIDLSKVSDGDHKLTFYSVDNVKNREDNKVVDFYLDSTVPVVEANIVGDQYQNRGRVFVSTRTKVRLIASDNKSGVKIVKYNVDGGTDKTYYEPFTLDKSKGNHIVYFYASDKVNNKFSGKLEESNLSRTSLDIDMDAPEIEYDFTGETYFSRDTSFVTSSTDIALGASDAESGVKGIGYKINGGAGQDYTGPFKLPGEGYYKVDFYGTDNVNNRNTKEFFFVVDNTGPNIEHIFSMEPVGKIILDEKEGDPIPVYTKGAKLFLAATDAVVDTDKIFYSIDGAKELEYKAPVVISKLGLLTYKVRAIDKLGNQTETRTFEVFVK